MPAAPLAFTLCSANTNNFLWLFPGGGTEGVLPECLGRTALSPRVAAAGEDVEKKGSRLVHRRWNCLALLPCWFTALFSTEFGNAATNPNPHCAPLNRAPPGSAWRQSSSVVSTCKKGDSGSEQLTSGLWRNAAYKVRAKCPRVSNTHDGRSRAHSRLERLGESVGRRSVNCSGSMTTGAALASPRAATPINKLALTPGVHGRHAVMNGSACLAAKAERGCTAAAVPSAGFVGPWARLGCNRSASGSLRTSPAKLLFLSTTNLLLSWSV